MALPPVKHLRRRIYGADFVHHDLFFQLRPKYKDYPYKPKRTLNIFDVTFKQACIISRYAHQYLSKKEANNFDATFNTKQHYIKNILEDGYNYMEAYEVIRKYTQSIGFDGARIPFKYWYTCYRERFFDDEKGKYDVNEICDKSCHREAVILISEDLVQKEY